MKYLEIMERTNRKSIMEYMKVFDPFVKESSFIEITEWTNGEGWDITIDDRHFHLHLCELDAINYLVKALTYGKEEPKADY